MGFFADLRKDASVFRPEILCDNEPDVDVASIPAGWVRLVFLDEVGRHYSGRYTCDGLFC